MRWPVLRQLRGSDKKGLGAAVRSRQTDSTQPRTSTADSVTQSICPYCGVGCGQLVYVKDEQVVQIEGDPDSPISRGRLCPKGAATLQLTTDDSRLRECLYRRPGAADWEPISLDEAMDMVADRIIETRRESWQWEQDDMQVRRNLGIAHLGGATLDIEENYLIKKLHSALGTVQVENQARVCHSSTVAGLGTSFGRGGATTFMQDLQNSDCIIIEGSNFAECHPVGFQWVMEAKARGATVIHVDPRYNRTAALSDVYVPIRAGTDIAFLGGIINHVLSNELEFRDYVLAYTNASSIVSEEFEDTEDLEGIFSGLDEEDGTYDPSSWNYQGRTVAPASGKRDQMYEAELEQKEGGRSAKDRRRAGGSEAAGGGGVPSGGKAEVDETLQHPRCVYQILKRHFARYTPEVVEDVCGIPHHLFRKVCDELVTNSGPDRTSAFAYAVGWTQHTVGAQYIRAASILQLLLGNIGRPGGGIQALRGHASIQGSTDVPTLFNLLPGYIPMPHAHPDQDLTAFCEGESGEVGYWANMSHYMVSLLKAWWGDAATEESDYCFEYLPRLTGAHGTYQTVMAQVDGTCKGYLILGENPAVGSANARMQRFGMANLDWLVVRDFSLTESATWWKDGPEIETGELQSAAIDTEVFFFPAASHTEKNGCYTNTNRWLQWHDAAVEPKGDARSDLWFMYHIGRKIREKLAGSTEPMDRPILDLTWDYPTEGPLDEPSADAILQEINGYDADGNHLSSYEQLKDDGSTTSGCWIYCGCYADGVNQPARKKPHTEQDWIAAEWAWAWPANRRILYNRAAAAPDGEPWSERKALVWWDQPEGEGSWAGHDVPDFEPHKDPTYEPPEGATGPDALAGDDPFIMQDDGKGWLYVPAGLTDGPLPTHYEAQESPVRNRLYRQQRNPVREAYNREHNRYQPSGDEHGADVYPFVVTTYRLTEHFTAGRMSRWTPYLSELQPEFFCEVSPELAELRGLRHNEWATIVSARSAIEARVMITDRMAPLPLHGQTIHQIGLPYHWGANGVSTGDAANELTSISLDPNVHIQEVKALTADIRPGRRPRGSARKALVEEYRQRAGIDENTGTEVRTEEASN